MLKSRLFLIMAIALIICIGHIFCISNACGAGTLKVHFIDVGLGDSILIQSPDGLNMLIDGGPDDAKDKLEAYLKSSGIKKIDVLIVTHPHDDHIGGLAAVVKDFDIGEIYMPMITQDTKTLEDLLSAVKAKGLKINSPMAGENINFASNLTATIFAPNSSKYDDINNYSIVIKLVYGKTSFLFTGDAQKESEAEMLAKGYDLKVDVLKVGHHGNNSSSTPDFIKAVSPKYAVISLGVNKYGLPNKETLEILNDAGATVYRTDEHGTIVVTSDGSKIDIKTEK